MIAILRWLFACAMTIVVIAFALVNGQAVEIIWNPFYPPADMPLFLPVLIAAAAGFLCGGFAVWLNGAAARREQRRQKKLIRTLEKQVEEMAEKDPSLIHSSPADRDAPSA